MRAEVAVVGNGVAGYACAARLARHGIRPLLVGPGLPIDRPPLTKQGLARGAPVLLADENRLADLGIERLDAMKILRAVEHHRFITALPAEAGAAAAREHRH